MKPLIVLFVVFALVLLAIRLKKGEYMPAFSGRIAMSAMLLFTAMGHFKFPDGMAMMVPEIFPFKLLLVYLTGFLEIAAAVGLLLPKFRRITGWLLIIFFLLVLPANIHAALHQVNYEQATYDGPGPSYLWIRVPMQILFMLWCTSAASGRLPLWQRHNILILSTTH